MGLQREMGGSSQALAVITENQSIADRSALAETVFECRDGAPRGNPAARILREKLLTRFEARDFSPRLMAVWDEVKAHYESGSKEPLWGLY